MASVLIVDDEALIRWSIAETLVSAGHHVLTAGTAAEALRLVDSGGDGLGVALLDLRLPDSSDLGFLRRFLQASPACRVILMTAHGTSEILEEAIRLGAFAVLTKPFDMRRVVDLIDQSAHTPEVV